MYVMARLKGFGIILLPPGLVQNIIDERIEQLLVEAVDTYRREAEAYRITLEAELSR